MYLTASQTTASNNAVFVFYTYIYIYIILYKSNLTNFVLSTCYQNQKYFY